MALLKCVGKTETQILGEDTAGGKKVHKYVWRGLTIDSASGPANWIIELDKKGYIKEVSMGDVPSGMTAMQFAKYKLYGKQTSNPTEVGTLIADNFSINSTVKVNNTGAYKYLNLRAYGPTCSTWEPELGGNYWYLLSTDFTVKYYHG